MARERYDDSLSHVLTHEGGYVNDPRDPGGATNFGVTQRTYDGYRKRKALTPQSVRLITRVEVGEIYRKTYWNGVRGDELPDRLDYCLFDGSVNSGPVQSIKWLQRALGTKVDGVMSDATLAAAEAYPDHDALIAAILDRRLAFMKALKGWRAFGKGWSRRVTEVRQIGQAWATGSVGPQPTYLAGMQARALVTDAKSVRARPSPMPRPRRHRDRLDQPSHRRPDAHRGQDRDRREGGGDPHGRRVDPRRRRRRLQAVGEPAPEGAR